MAVATTSADQTTKLWDIGERKLVSFKKNFSNGYYTQNSA